MASQYGAKHVREVEKILREFARIEARLPSLAQASDAELAEAIYYLQRIQLGLLELVQRMHVLDCDLRAAMESVHGEIGVALRKLLDDSGNDVSR